MDIDVIHNLYKAYDELKQIQDEIGTPEGLSELAEERNLSQDECEIFAFDLNKLINDLDDIIGEI